MYVVVYQKDIGLFFLCRL